MEILGKLFGSVSKVKVMKLFLFNPGSLFDLETIAKKTRVSKDKTKKEILALSKIGLLKKTFDKKTTTDSKGNKKTKKVTSWVLEDKFIYLKPLRTLLLNTEFFSSGDINKRLRKAGKLKLVILSGIFINNSDSRVDILVVGDSLKRTILERIVADIESELGRDLKYSILDTSDFEYRLDVCDRLVRDILDYPHQKILNKLNI
jgi:hypothetical protein